MIPEGTIHMPFTGIAKVAKKLQIQYVPAVVAFDFVYGKATPRIHGIVVECQYEDILKSALREWLMHSEKVEAEKKEARAIRNWARLAKGLISLEKLREKYL